MSASLLQALRQTFGAKDCVFFESPLLGGVFGVGATERVEIRGGRAQVVGSGRVLAGEALPAVAQRLQDLSARAGLSDAPAFLRGGLCLGWVGFDFVRFLEPRLQRQGLFKELQAGDTPDGEFGLFLDFIVVEKNSAPRVFCLSGDKAKQRRLEALVAQHVETATPPATEAFAENMDLHASLGRSAFLSRVARLKEHIAAGDIFQAVLSERFEVPGRFDADRVFAALERTSDAPYRFFLPLEDGFFLGASPEMFLRSEQGALETHPIAGTRPTGRDATSEARYAAELLTSDKERAEHLMLVDLARNDLGRVSEPGTVQVPEYMALKKFRSILHLASRVTGRLRAGAGALDAFGASFPAGTLSGAPKVRALEILSEMELVPRGPYGGAVVALSANGDLESCIAIRALRLESDRAILQAGAGIVADSIGEHEHLEIHNKLRPLRQALCLAGVA